MLMELSYQMFVFLLLFVAVNEVADDDDDDDDDRNLPVVLLSKWTRTVKIV